MANSNFAQGFLIGVIVSSMCWILTENFVHESQNPSQAIDLQAACASAGWVMPQNNTCTINTVKVIIDNGSVCPSGGEG
jgi:hypothetical protein